MKTNEKITRKDFTNYHVLGVGYCELQTLLAYERRNGYNSGVYGWNYDAYLFPNYDLAIVTGYSFPNKYKIDRNLYKDYEEKAQKINNDYSIDPTQKREQIETLLDEFLKTFVK